METSAKSGENVELLFATLAKHLFLTKGPSLQDTSTTRLDTSLSGPDRLKKSFRLSAMGHSDAYSPVSVVLDSHVGTVVSERPSVKPKRKRCCYKS